MEKQRKQQKAKRPALAVALFLGIALAVFLALDALALTVLKPFFLRSGRFWLDDFELTQRAHPEEVWDKVFYGSSDVYAGYREEESGSGYVNLGMDNATIRDLWELIDGGFIRIGSELVIGVDELTFYDDFPTNPYYIWHRKPYEPYVYFARARIQQLLRETAEQVLGISRPGYNFIGQTKTLYRGAMSKEELEEKMASPSYRPYLYLISEDFDENFAALEKVADWCGANGVRLRMIFMPSNPIVTRPVSVVNAFRRLDAFCAGHGVELRDMRDDFGDECFYDGSHLNWEYGSHQFTKEIESWLNS